MAIKISIYPTPEQKEKLQQLAKAENLSLSQYLLKMGLQEKIQSNKNLALLASSACQLYALANEVENPADRLAIKKMGERIYGALENSAS